MDVDPHTTELPSSPSPVPTGLDSQPSSVPSSSMQAPVISMCTAPNQDVHLEEVKPHFELELTTRTDESITPKENSLTLVPMGDQDRNLAEAGEEESSQHDQALTPIDQTHRPGLHPLTPSKSPDSTSSSSSSDSMTGDDDVDDDGFSDDSENEEVEDLQLKDLSLLDSDCSLPPHSTPCVTSTTSLTTQRQSKKKKADARLAACTTPGPTATSFGSGARSEPGPPRKAMGRKRSVSGLVALRYRSTGRDGKIDEEERGMLALDLDAYINSSDHRETSESTQPSGPLSPSALFPTLLTTTLDTEKSKMKNPQLLTIDTLPHRSQWVVGSGTGPGNAHRGFIPGVLNDS
ncbi:uncharacterized protein MELLADRAFT_79159 [Melampsora larici-populina 98AG31]|uniref:Uncharacterized protein n=1 Tax=Melampsora larici-populina (strain 98AG31 / pathotype 3-4-7) TaxID=747676 RepID=F4S3H7_MELLP|nr:uncharacterized protein MELLADRAFT_79159 [Melampsora larici-populina 98AG31]EGG00814.1 hypothetical protein MELLADRAFT_79159 [Melampsora larici-populina 98AG31]